VNTRLSQTQTVRASQEQLLNPTMLQSLKILALPIMELSAMLSQEIMANPLLEMGDDLYEGDAPGEEKDKPTEEKSESQDDSDDLQEIMTESKELSEILDQWNEYHSDLSTKGETTSKDDEPNFENYIASEDNLRLEYMQTFETLDLSEDEFSFIYDLIDAAETYGMLPKGYNIYELAKEYKLTPTRADELHLIVMQTKPRGITARDISECLYYQLEPYEREHLQGLIVKNDFNDLLYKRYSTIAKKYNVDEDEVLECRDRIGKLDPKPGLRIHSGKAQYIVPDLFLLKMGDEFEIIINDFNIPSITFSRRYQNILSEMARDKAAINYVRGKINSARFLIRTIFQRHKTLERVMRCILDHQHDFFYNNSGILNPLNYATLAGEIGVNESTISRVVKTKYADTHLGVFCLKEFFCTNAAKNNPSESVSRASVQQQVKAMIADEDSNAPISDQDMVERLKERGINVSRRVITKYREAMNIPNSRSRKV